MRVKRLGKDILLYVAPVTFFLCSAISHLELPGIHYDEVYYVPPAAALLKAQPDADYVMIDPSTIRVFGHPLPLMFNYYTSFFRTFLTLPIFYLFGINVATIRGSSIFLGVVALVFSIAFVRRLWSRRDVAFLSGMLLALDASFVAYIRHDYAVVGTMMALKLVALWALIRWWQDRRAGFLYLGAFCLGLGVTDRASFLWIPIALVPTLILIYGQNIKREFWSRIDRSTTIATAGLVFSLGASIFLAFNLATLGGTFSPMIMNFRNTEGGVDNLAFLTNFYLRIRMLVEVLGGEYLNHFLLGELGYQTPGWKMGHSPLSWLFPLAYIYYLLRTVRAYWKKRQPESIILCLLSMTLWLLVLSCFTPTLLRGHQLLMLYPLPHILIAVFIVEVLTSLSRIWPRPSARLWHTAYILVVSLLVSAMVRPIVAYHDLLVKTGGRGVWSDAIYEIVAEVDRHPDWTVVCMDWGFNANILALTRNRVETVRNYYDATRRSPRQLAALFDGHHVFLFHTPEFTLMPEARQDFDQAVALVQARLDMLRTFYQRDGRPLAYLVQVTTGIPSSTSP